MFTYVMLALGLTFPAILSLVDCFNRPPEAFEDGAADRQGWLRWLAIAIPLCAVFVGYAIVLSYYYGVVRRAGSAGR